MLWLVALAYISYKTLNEPTAKWNAEGTAPAGAWWQHVGDLALAALDDFTGVGIGIAILAMLLTRPVNLIGEFIMSLYQAMVNRFVIPVIAQHEARGRAAERAEWRAWNRRRMNAEAQGQPFNEPPPGEPHDNLETLGTPSDTN